MAVKRLIREAGEFTVVGSHLIEVTNASYGYPKSNHTYVVGVEEHEGLTVPIECECPTDVYREPHCKHKVALATMGGPTVLDSTVAFENPALASSDSDSMTTADRLRADGGKLRLTQMWVYV